MDGDDYWRNEEYKLAGMLLCAARQAKHLLNHSDGPDPFVQRVYEMCVNYANAFAPPGEPEHIPQSAKVIYMDSWRARNT